VAPSVARAFTGNDGRVGSTGVRLGGWGDRWVKDKVTDVSKDLSPKKVAFSSSLLFLHVQDLILGSSELPPCIPKL